MGTRKSKSNPKLKLRPTIDGRVVEEGSLDDCLDFVTRGLHAAGPGSMGQWADYLMSLHPPVRRKKVSSGRKGKK